MSSPLQRNVHNRLSFFVVTYTHTMLGAISVNFKERSTSKMCFTPGTERVKFDIIVSKRVYPAVPYGFIIYLYLFLLCIFYNLTTHPTFGCELMLGMWEGKGRRREESWVMGRKAVVYRQRMRHLSRIYRADRHEVSIFSEQKVGS